VSRRIVAGGRENFLGGRGAVGQGAIGGGWGGAGWAGAEGGGAAAMVQNKGGKGGGG